MFSSSDRKPGRSAGSASCEVMDMKGGSASGSAAAAEQSRQSRGGTLGPRRSHAARVCGSNGSTRVAVVLVWVLGLVRERAGRAGGPVTLQTVWVL